MNRIKRNARPGGFTLVELLVVISIIALLISILLPSIGKAREQAKTVVCATRIKGILSAMHIYAAEHNGFIAGSPNTTGSALFGRPYLTDDQHLAATSFPYNPCQVFDFAGGLYPQMNMRLSNQTLKQRFIEILNNKAYQCPSNRYRIEYWDDLPQAWNFDRLPLNSYNTARNFLIPANRQLMASKFMHPDQPNTVDPRWDAGGGGQLDYAQGGGGVGWLNYMDPNQPSVGYNEGMPPGYIPQVEKVGSSSGKVYIADGCRYIDSTLQAPDYNPKPYAAYGGDFSDPGPYTKYSRSWHRAHGDPGFPQAPPQLQATPDIRLFSYRHGRRSTGGRWGLFRMNVGFYDSHVETMNDSESANPHLWLPSGGKLRTTGVAANQIFGDVLARWGNTPEGFIRIR